MRQQPQRMPGLAKLRVESRADVGVRRSLRSQLAVPRIPDIFLDGAFYLYRSVEAAKAGEKAGGTGFFVAVRSEEKPGAHYLYAVSNWHVAMNGGFSVIRVNTLTGDSDIIELGPEDWEFDPQKGYDIALAPIQLNNTHHRFGLVEREALVTRDRFFPGGPDKSPIGVGDEIFMVGRFVDHDGGVTNQPAARFGSISIGPSRLRSALGKDVETLCLDTNSRTGYSGSPVFVYRTAFSDLGQLMELDDGKPNIPSIRRPFLMLLGIHTGQFPEWYEYRENEATRGDEAASKGQVRGLSGMTRVAPAWCIDELLDLPKLKRRREASEAFLRAQKNRLPGGASGEEAADLTTLDALE